MPRVALEQKAHKQNSENTAARHHTTKATNVTLASVCSNIRPYFSTMVCKPMTTRKMTTIFRNHAVQWTQEGSPIIFMHSINRDSFSARMSLTII